MSNNKMLDKLRSNGVAVYIRVGNDDQIASKPEKEQRKRLKELYGEKQYRQLMGAISYYNRSKKTDRDFLSVVDIMKKKKVPNQTYQKGRCD